MPLTVTASNFIAYHLWQLPLASNPELQDEHDIAVITNELTDGYRVESLVGFTAGTRTWNLTFPTLAHLDILPLTLTDANGAAVSREAYVRSVFMTNKTTDVPFVYEWRGAYYFVDFDEDMLSMKRMRIKLYSSGLTMKQRRLAGVTLPSP